MIFLLRITIYLHFLLRVSKKSRTGLTAKYESQNGSSMKFKSIFLLFIFIVSTVVAEDKRKVALVPFSNSSAAKNNWVPSGLEYMLNNKLSVVSGFFVIDKNVLLNTMSQFDIDPGKISDKNSGQIGRNTGAEVTVSGTIIDSASQLVFEVYYHNTTNGSLIHKEKIPASSSTLAEAADKVIAQLLNISGITVSSRERNMMKRRLTNSPQAFESFIKAYMESQKARSDTRYVISNFKAAIAKDKKFWEAYYNLGIVYFNTKKYRESLNEFNKIIKALPRFDKPYYGRGLIYEKQKKYDLAIRDFKKVTEFNPNDPKPYYYMGKISILAKKFTEAQTYLDKAAELNPDFAPTYYEYGNMQVAQKQIRKSINDYRKAVTLNPNNTKYRLTLGEVYYRSQIYYNALIEFNTVLKSIPNHAVANFMRGVTIYKQAVLEDLVEAFLDILDESNGKKKGKVEKKFTKSKGMDPVKRGKVYEDMVQAFTKAAQARPKFKQATFNLALTYLEMGKLALAENYFKKTILIAPKMIKAHMKLATVYEESGKLQQAVDQYKRVFYLQPGIFVHKPTLGPKHQYKNVLEIFMAELNKKVKRSPNNIEANIVLAKVFSAQGFNGKAANLLRSLISKNPRNNEAKKLLATIEKGQR